jgi:hypothetical protein
MMRTVVSMPYLPAPIFALGGDLAYSMTDHRHYGDCHPSPRSVSGLDLEGPAGFRVQVNVIGVLMRRTNRGTGVEVLPVPHDMPVHPDGHRVRVEPRNGDHT